MTTYVLILGRRTELSDNLEEFNETISCSLTKVLHQLDVHVLK